MRMRHMQYLFDDDMKLLKEVERVESPGILTGQVLYNGPLGEGVSSPTKVDTVAKSMIKFVRVKIVDVPMKFLERGS